MPGGFKLLLTFSRVQYLQHNNFVLTLHTNKRLIHQLQQSLIVARHPQSARLIDIPNLICLKILSYMLQELVQTRLAMFSAHPPNMEASSHLKVSEASAHEIMKPGALHQHAMKTRTLGTPAPALDIFMAIIIFELSKAQISTQAGGKSCCPAIVLPITIGTTTKNDFVEAVHKATTQSDHHNIAILWHLFPQGSGLGGAENTSFGTTSLQHMNDEVFWSCVKKMQARENHGLGQDYFTCEVKEASNRVSGKAAVTVRNANGDIVDLSSFKNTPPRSSVTIRNQHGDIIDLNHLRDSDPSATTISSVTQGVTASVSAQMPTPMSTATGNTLEDIPPRHGEDQELDASAGMESLRAFLARLHDLFDDSDESSTTSDPEFTSNSDNGEEQATPHPHLATCSHAQGNLDDGVAAAERLEARLAAQRISAQEVIEDRFRRGIPVLRPGPIVRKPQFCVAPKVMEPLSATFHHVDDEDEQDREDVFAPRRNARFRNPVDTLQRGTSRDDATTPARSGATVKQSAKDDNENGGALVH